MKKLIQIFVISLLFLGSITLVAQNNPDSKKQNMSMSILEEMPSLDFFGERTFSSENSAFAKAIEKNITLNNDGFRLAILNEMPSLDFFNEAKYHIIEKEKRNFTTSKDIGLVNNAAYYKQLFMEMPSLDF
ncbi:MAG: hypothetical protein ACON5F_11260 [Jejuia sp.]